MLFLTLLFRIHAFNESWSTLSKPSDITPSTGGYQIFKTFIGVISEKINKLKPINKDFHLTKVLDSVMELKETNGVEKFLYLDPKYPHNSVTRKNTPFREAIVFVVGGGNYYEMQNIMEFFKKSQENENIIPKHVIYGTTEIISPSQFLSQLQQLGRKN